MSKILLIEDNEANRDLMSRYLQLFGHEVAAATNGVAGLALLQANQASVDIVLLDVGLPDMDGLEVTRRIKANPATESLPVIAITAHAMVGDRERALEAGCNDYTTKPVDFKILMEKIESLVNKACPHE